MKTFLKVLNWIAWISTCIGLILMLLSILSYWSPPDSNILGFEHRVNYFITANSFFMITIIIFIYLYMNEHKK